jgi:NAD(P)-dependent dehydrogenase (short-subunit alcohol dehydrogenase family)
MKRTIVVCGHGPGISDAVARKFGREGFQVAIVARNAERIEKAAAGLKAAGIDAKAFPCDLGDANATRAMLAKVRSTFGPITALQWTAYPGSAGDLATAPLDELRGAMDVALFGLVAAVQEALPDLKSQKGAVLVTNGGLGLFDAKVDAMTVQFKAMGLGVANAAKHKLARLLHVRLAPEGVYVGEVMVTGTVKGTAWDQGNATIEPSAVADKFWQMFQSRSEATVTIS